MFTMSASKELTAIEKFVALAVVAVIVLVVVLVIGLIARSGGDSASRTNGCDTRFDATACPEPDYDSTAQELRGEQ
jgi:hypothetical protein